MSELAKALLAFQKDAPSLERTAEGQVRGRTTYKYVSLDSAMAAIRPKLNEHGLVITQALHNRASEDVRGRYLATSLIHAESGEERQSQCLLPDTDNMQELGSAITYARRYSLVAMLGLVADEDDDGVRSVAQRQQQPVETQVPPDAPPAAPFPQSIPETVDQDGKPAKPTAETLRLINKVLGDLAEMRPDIDWVEVARTVAQTKFNKQDSQLLNDAEMFQLAHHMEKKLEQKDPGVPA